MIRSGVTFVLLSMIIAGTAAQAASFNCAKALTYVETAICADHTVSQLDESLASAYRTAMAKSTNPSELRNDQRAWLAERDRCNDIYCVGTAIEKRIEALGNNSAPELQPATPKFTPEPTPGLAPAVVPEYESAPAYSQGTPQSAPEPAYTQPPQSAVAESERFENTYPTQQSAGGYVDQAAATYSQPEPHQTYKSPGPNQKSDSALPYKIGFVLLVIICLTAIFLHHQGKLTIYHDYTDATFTSLIPLTVILFQWLLNWLEIPKPYPLYTSLILGASLSFFVIRSTYAANGFNVGFFMALIAKVTMIGVYYAIMAALLSSGSGRKKGESQAAFAARQRREAKAATSLMIFITAAFTWLSGLLCRQREFSNIGDYLTGRTH